MRAIAAVVDIALHARPQPVAAKALAARLDLPPRRLETLLQALVRANILVGVRGPRGGYELARERRRITAADIVRAAIDTDEDGEQMDKAQMIRKVVAPMVLDASQSMLQALEAVTVETLCRAASKGGLSEKGAVNIDFTI